VADNPQDTIRELRALVVAYTQQETVEPLKGLGRYAGYGLGGALFSGLGAVFIAIGLLRLIEDEGGVHFTGNWSWVPYAAVMVLSVIAAALAWSIGTRRKKKAI
jgi:hypothetical protein